MILAQHDIAQKQENKLPTLRGFDYVEMYVGNASQAAHFFRTTFGFTPIACAGLETGCRDRASYLLEQGDIRLILTAAVTPESPVADHVRLHGDSIKDISFRVDDAEQVFNLAVQRGARPVMEPTRFESESGTLTKATIGVYGSTVHSFVQRDDSSQTFFPEFRRLESLPPPTSINLKEIDHIAICVDSGTLDEWIEFYINVLNFHQSHQEDIITELSAMNSKVVEDESGSIKFPMMEPAPGKRKSQIEEYLVFHAGAGAQHIALSSDDIVEAVRVLRSNNIEFLHTPDTYYQMLKNRVGEISADLKELHETKILVDRDEWGYLMQVFTKPLQSRPTLFAEVIQRVGARGFGAGNIKALFEALEYEQAKRGNL